MLPFSFCEYLECIKENNFPAQTAEENYYDYVKFGSMPFTVQLKKNTESVYQYLNGVYNTIIVKDIARRHQIKDVAVLEAVIKFTISYFTGDHIILNSVNAIPVTAYDQPEIYRLVENLCITRGLPSPKIYILNDNALNAFATGRDPIP